MQRSTAIPLGAQTPGLSQRVGIDLDYPHARGVAEVSRSGCPPAPEWKHPLSYRGSAGECSARRTPSGSPRQRLSAYVLEWTLHHLDLIAHLPDAANPPAEGLARSRELLERIAGTAFPSSFSDTDALLIGTGRRAPAEAEKAELGELASKLPFVIG